MPPVVVDGGGGPAADADRPAPGAQPAAPGAAGALPQVDVAAANPADVAADAAAGLDPNAAVQEVEVTPAFGDVPANPAEPAEPAVAPIEVDATPQPVAAPAPVTPVVDGGGTGGGAAVAPPTATAAPGGTLPFTGATQNLLLITLAGMFVPVGVLLYSAAQRGDLRRLRRHLEGPRFQWAAASHVDPTGALRPRQELAEFDWTGADWNAIAPRPRQNA
ncbi:MAG: hypothetical protein KDC46_01130 [Thermoleophilia bacterium]|nr:hypothetical protein [Thermoleophilia bacterium]